MNRIIETILIFAAQVLVLNHLDFMSYLYPQLFILILIGLPAYINKSTQVALAFILGLAADLFVATPGIHASACMLIVFLRFGFINRYDMEEIIANRASLNIRTLGLPKYIIMSSILVLVYHVMVFGLESLGAFNGLAFLLTVLVSTTTTMGIILLIQLLFYSK